MASNMAIYQNKECMLKKSSRFCNKSGRQETELKSGRLPLKSVELTCMLKVGFSFLLHKSNWNLIIIETFPFSWNIKSIHTCIQFWGHQHSILTVACGGSLYVHVVVPLRCWGWSCTWTWSRPRSSSPIKVVNAVNLI